MSKSRNKAVLLNVAVLLPVMVLTYWASMQGPMLLAEMIILGMFVFPAVSVMCGLLLTGLVSFVFRLAPFRQMVPALALSAVVGVGLVGTAMAFDEVSDHYFHVAMQKEKLEEADDNGWVGQYGIGDHTVVLVHIMKPSFLQGAVDLYGLYDSYYTKKKLLTELRTEDELWEQLRREQKLTSAVLLDVEIDERSGELRFFTEEPTGQFWVKVGAEQGQFKYRDVRFVESEVFNVE
ncbi:hypothetical protein OS242_13460 [Tumebacillus sp. DT12]|uniref:Uncharacterized protein n=1 Tax=Tumebacillus lacus TaxID=2995335 RepID=A0ABT3X5P5_9BACL|nr:hypothetical protein [Tumebacillus lacus]MCX7570951.1 hypothetical protein [Tumebacillus lacus]